MKRHILAALAAGLIAPAAAAAELGGSVYGDFRLSLGWFDADSTGDDTDVDNNHSHLGLRVQAVEGELTAFAQYERLADNDDGDGDAEPTRQFFAGLRHAHWGTLSYGRQATAYKLAGQKLDPFYNTSVAGISGTPGVINGASYGQSALTNDAAGNGFVNNQVAFTTPSFGGLTVNGAVFVDDGAGDGENHDYAAGAEWRAGGVTLGVQGLDLQSGSEAGSVANFDAIGLSGPNGELEALRGYGAWASERWGAGASYERLDLKNGQPDREYVFVSGWLGLTDRIRLAAAIGDTHDTPFEGRGYTLGASYEVIERLNVYAAARLVDRTASPTNTTLTEDTQTVALGVSYAFEIALD